MTTFITPCVWFEKIYHYDKTKSDKNIMIPNQVNALNPLSSY